VTKANIIDPAVADAAFTLKEGETSTAIQGRFGTVIVQVRKIEPAMQRPYETVADSIKKTLGEQRAKAEIGSLRDKIEDERAAGSNLFEVAKKLGLVARSIEAIDRSGRDAAGLQVPNLPQGADVVAAAFSTDVGVETDPLQLPNNGLVWVDVAGITLSRERSLDEVKDIVEARWRDEEVASRLRAQADDMLAKIKAGAALPQVAAEAGLKVETASGLQRGKPTPQIGAKALDAIFRTAKGVPASSDGDRQSERIVFSVTEIDVPKADPAAPEAKTLSSTLRQGYGEAIVNEYVAKLESEIGVTINDAALNQVTGGGATN
jgi:peptidyl-prolyl cis-trans isomerase D